MANKIDREDMLALTRRMNVSRCSFTRIAGCYVDGDGDFDGSFNVNFLKLSAEEKKRNIELAKAVPFAATNVNLKRYEFSQEDMRPGTVWQLLMALRESEAVFEYLICVICPLADEYEPGAPECGFLFPAYTDGGADLNHAAVFQADKDRPHRELAEKILGVK